MQGWATQEGTARFHANAALPPWAVRQVFGLTLAAIGVGTYAGAADAAADAQQIEAIAACMERIVEAGLVRSWGISSWNGFRVREDHPEYLPLDLLPACSTSHLRYLQYKNAQPMTGRRNMFTKFCR